MDHQQAVTTFVHFFRDRGHHPIASHSLITPPADPVLFTTSGMHPLTPYLNGQAHPAGNRLTGVQRCLRTTDLEEVGDLTHLTMFEMLGSWSLGDYAGPQSLCWGFELVTGAFGLERGRLHATVFGGDGQAGPDTELAATWARLGVPVELTGAENWWSNGPTGLCGTDSELFAWTGSGPPQGSPVHRRALGGTVEPRDAALPAARGRHAAAAAPAVRGHRDGPGTAAHRGAGRPLRLRLRSAAAVVRHGWAGLAGAGRPAGPAGHQPSAGQRCRARRRGAAVQYRARLRAASADPPRPDRAGRGGSRPHAR